MKTLLYGFKRYWKRRMPLSFLTAFLSLLAVTCDLIFPLLGADIINFYFYGGKVDENDVFAFLFADASLTPLQTFGKVAVVFGTLILIRVAFVYLRNVTLQFNGVGMENEMRKDSYQQLMDMDSQTLAGMNSGELMAMIDWDNNAAKDLYCSDFLTFFDSVVSIVMSVVFLARINASLLIMPVLFAPFFLLTLARYTKAIARLQNKARDLSAALSLSANENIQAVRIVRSFANEEREIKRFNDTNSAIRDTAIQVGKVSARYNALFEFYRQAAYVVTIAVSAILVMKGNILLGSLSAATSYVLKIMGQVSSLSSLVGTMQAHIIAMNRIQGFLETPTAIPDYPGAIVLSPRPHIELKDVSLTLGNTPILKHIDLDVPFGKKVGIMGGTGSGKSVLLKTLSRIYEVTDGAVTIDGVNVKQMPLETLRNEYGYVFQDVFLFSHTIDANIAYYDDTAEREEVQKTAEISQAHPFISKMPDGYETIIGERGMGLSGGQKQRISVARALMKRAPVLVLDDASSALDMTTERKVMEGIKKAYPDITMFIAAHRVASVLDCDEIIYMQDGEIVERGTVEELVKLDGRFAKIYHMQMADGQLDDSSYGASEYEKEGGTAV